MYTILQKFYSVNLLVIKVSVLRVLKDIDGGQLGIRTLDRLPYTRVPGERLRPLGQLSIKRDAIVSTLDLNRSFNRSNHYNQSFVDRGSTFYRYR